MSRDSSTRHIGLKPKLFLIAWPLLNPRPNGLEVFSCCGKKRMRFRGVSNQKIWRTYFFSVPSWTQFFQGRQLWSPRPGSHTSIFHSQVALLDWLYRRRRANIYFFLRNTTRRNSNPGASKIGGKEVLPEFAGWLQVYWQISSSNHPENSRFGIFLQIINSESSAFGDN